MRGPRNERNTDSAALAPASSSRSAETTPNSTTGPLTRFAGTCGVLLAWIGVPGAWSPPPTTAGEPHVDGDATAWLSAARIAGLPPPQRAAWTGYVESSDRWRARDRASMDAELRAAGKTAMTPGPYLKAFRVAPEMTAAWFHTDQARRGADNMLTFQTPSGGWSKRIDLTTRPRALGESYFSENAGWTYVATIDNDSTTEELRYLAAAFAAQADPRYRDAVLRGIEFLLQAQFPNGCWPQGYPLQGGYHDAATFNDNAMVNVLRLLSEVGAGAGEMAFVPAAVRRRAADAVPRGVDCILAAQVVVDGRKTVWAQQHDPLTLAPVPARSYELRGLCGRESAWVTSFLMTVPAPDARVVAAVEAAVAWFRAHELYGYVYDHYQLTRSDGAGPLWARLTEIETDRAIFSNRDGVKLYDWDRLTDRRQGYMWFSKEPAATLQEYARWPAARAAASKRSSPPEGGPGARPSAEKH